MVWTLKNATLYDKNEICDCLRELLRAMDGDETACTALCYNPDNTDLWLCFEAGVGDIFITLASGADRAGYPQGKIYTRIELYSNYVRQILEQEGK